MNEEDDESIIKELPLYLSHDLSEHLFVYQFPTRPANYHFENANVVKCAIKPENQEVLMEIAMDTSTNNYDIGHGEQIALNVDGSKDRPTHEKCFQSPLMDKTSLQSVRVLVDIGSVAVAAFSDTEVVVTPIAGIVSMQPCFPYLDLTEKRAKEELKEQGDPDISGGEEDEEKQITVKFARQESDRVKKAREKSFHYLAKKSAEEPWYNTVYNNSSSQLAKLKRKLLLQGSGPRTDETSSLCLKPQHYLDALLPTVQEEIWSAPSLPSNVLSLNALRTMPLADQVRLILRDVKVMTFNQLSTLLVGCGDLVKLLRSVQQTAVLVLGNWVVRSDFLYPKESFSTHNGVPGEIMARARDYILYLLGELEGRCVDRRQIALTLKLPPDELKEILVQIARLRPSKGWVFILPQDKDFIERYPDVVERQALWWEARNRTLREAFGCRELSPSKPRTRKRESSMSGGSDIESPVRSRTGPVNSIKPRRRKDSSISSDTESGAEGDKRRVRKNSECGGRTVVHNPSEFNQLNGTSK